MRTRSRRCQDSHFWRTVALLTFYLSLFVAGCGGGKSDNDFINEAVATRRAELTEKRALWSSKGVRNYRFTATYTTKTYERAVIEAEVQNGVSTAFRVVEEQNLIRNETEALRAKYGTVDLLFTAAEERITTVPQIRAYLSYDDALGYPRNIGTGNDTAGRTSETPDDYFPRIVVNSLSVTE